MNDDGQTDLPSEYVDVDEDVGVVLKIAAGGYHTCMGNGNDTRVCIGNND